MEYLVTAVEKITGCFGVTLCLLVSAALRDMFGEESVDFSDEKNISVTVDGKTILVCLETRVRQEALCVVVEICFLLFY